MNSLQPNEIFNLAADIIRNTSRSVFLTGKAGTGKTTFLHYIRDNVSKNVIVAAPTGVAAINAGGVTLHSLLQLPFEPFIPNQEGRKKLDYHFKLRKSKIDMLRELDLLIIDEVSMLRADILDAIDHMLRRFRNPYEPFGGVQMLYIGDMFQLPPVVQNHEWAELKPYYPSPFFFHAQVLNDNLPLYIELKTIYRQKDQQFIDLLNKVRNNCATENDLKLLNSRYDPNFELNAENKYIVLCTHNSKADKINREELSRLPGSTHTFDGNIRGDFAENSLPAELQLTLKEGAQVMFVRNDAGENRRFYNGKLATISYINQDKIFVRFEDETELELERETWRNVRYVLNSDSGDIQEDELGTFTQYPVRLAWAITIHKSQGLTFDRVAIDAGQAFAGGQVYVALSRCTTLDGIVLFSRISPTSIQTDKDAIAFSLQQKSTDYLRSVLNDEKPRYIGEQLKKAFDWSAIVYSVRSFNQLVAEKKMPKKEEAQQMASDLIERAAKQDEFARNFRKELDRILASPTVDEQYLKERIQKAVLYFHTDIQTHILTPLMTHIDSLKNASKVKQYLVDAKEILETIETIISKLENVYYGNTKLTEGMNFVPLQLPEIQPEEKEEKEKKKQVKGDSQRLTLTLFNEGKNIVDIAAERNLSPTTIQTHLAAFVRTGEISIQQLMDAEKIEEMMRLIQKTDQRKGLTELKAELPEIYSYYDLKLILAHLAYQATEK